MQDICRSLTIIRQNAVDWNVNPGQIAVFGFSAGGHAAASHAVFWKRTELFSIEGVNNSLVEPNALILAYPVITSGKFAHKESIQNLIGDNPSPELLDLVSLENQVSCSTPPVFLWHTF